MQSTNLDPSGDSKDGGKLGLLIKWGTLIAPVLEDQSGTVHIPIP